MSDLAHDLDINDPAFLRRQADHCRTLARAAASPEACEELLVDAVEYEADAANIENDGAARQAVA
jgi:hypothetical protein